MSVERSECGSGGCVTCPFSCNDEAERVQNYGCLPSAYDIIEMKEKSGHNWACHGDESVMCGGFANYVKQRRTDLDVKIGGLISYDTWYRHGVDAALLRASGKYVLVEQECVEEGDIVWITYEGRPENVQVEVKLLLQNYLEGRLVGTNQCVTFEIPKIAGIQKCLRDTVKS